MINKLKPALLGGLITGILCLIPFVSTCCCVWAAGGGLLASFLYIRTAVSPVSTGEGAVLGLMSGAFGSVIYLFIGLPIMLIFGVAGMEEQIRQTGVDVPLGGLALALITVFLVVILILVFSALGGLLGIPLFEKRKADTIPPPPPDLGGGRS